jgi:signal transduction histidine kinase
VTDSTAKNLNLTIVLHDLKNKLGQIRGNLELIADFGPVNEGQARSIARADMHIDEMMQAINALFSAQDQPGPPAALARDEVTWTAVYFEVASQLEMHARSKNITLALQPPAESVPFEADYGQCEHVLLNLIGNAIKYGRRGGFVHVSTFLDPDSGQVVLCVIDDGVGIPKKDAARIFDRNFRASNAAHSPIEGGGMGLYIVREIVEMHGGTVAVESAVRKGTTITVRLPLKQP